mmetsp:Transcript_30511/g.35252  ORF Transcript_30511/g.35252 Transcript_30511/m.35252 type:complete len:205 (-) Transcript_30511:77-691(-)|eukprot:CAMPEP_0176408666 /NCGR_PEP_ID=MMETSP0127-20121128/2084_1 /TAXON_ID=938130 /ORGANISM="Platyophrya macrostoma, Strain WH" /LENGTH=204 /DNA_ID=CAMNT_0017787989 /DNA_START=48 /DNA_END=662 /DNA_ORIENTATION=+
MPEAAKRSVNEKNPADTVKADAVSDGQSSPARKLTDDEIKRCAERLSQQPHRDDTLPPLLPKKILSKDQLETSVQKLYTMSIAKRKQVEDENERKRSAEDLKPRVMSANELDGTFDRLYTQQMELNRKNEQRRREQEAAANRSRKLNKDEQIESAKRLCDATIEKARESHRSLFEKYVTATEPKYRKLTKDELAASAARLSKKE